MPNQITGRLLAIGQTVQIPTKSGNQFNKREFLLDATTFDPYTGERSQYENILPLEVSEDKCVDLDRFKVGDVVTVFFALQGRSWKTQDGELKRMIGIRCYKLEKRASGTQVDVQHPVPQQSAHAAVPPQDFPPSVDEAGIPKDDLPF